LFTLEDDEVLADTLERALGEIALEPVANADGPYTAGVNETIAFNGSSSFDPDSHIVEWAWDFDNDGTFDEVGNSPVVSHAYAAPYDGQVLLRVTSEDGGVTTAIGEVDVTHGGRQPGPPSPPIDVKAAPGDEPNTVRLSWSPPWSQGDDEVRGFRILSDDGTVVALIDNGTQTEVVIDDLPAGTNLQFGVEAGNEFGFNAPAESNVIRLGGTPPDCTTVSVDRTEVWPPNGKFVLISASGGRDDDSDAPLTLAIDSITQDEPTGGEEDARLSDPPGRKAWLRAERDGSGDGRVYRLHVTATDAEGLTCETIVAVSVPHDRGKSRAVDSAPPTYDSLSS
jgi:PKD domain/Fibronectin type III domain